MLPLLNPSPKDIKEVAFYLYKKWQTYTIEKKMIIADKGRKNKLLLDVLMELYPNHNFLTYGSETFPVISFNLIESQIFDIESILGNLKINDKAEVDVHLLEVGGRYVDFLKQLGRPLSDLPTYSLESVDFGANLKINCKIGSYFDALSSCDILEWEILSEIENLNEYKSIKEFIEKHLKIRRYVHNLCGSNDPVLHPIGRSAALSISTLILFNRGKDYAFLVGERSAQGVAIHGDMYHVIPSGIFQPTIGDRKNEYSVSHGIFREYLEELFGLKEMETPPAIISYDYFYNNNNLKYIKSLLESGSAKLYLTGFIVNALNLRPEICTMLYIEDPQWFINHSTGNSELERIELNSEWKKPNEKSQGKSNVISTDEVHQFGITSENTVPPGAASIILGLRLAYSRGFIK